MRALVAAVTATVLSTVAVAADIHWKAVDEAIGRAGATQPGDVQSAGNGKAAATGDFVLTAGEVEPVVQSLVANGIEVTALHTHMLGEEPRLYFMHFWGVDDPAKLGFGLRAALDKVNIARGQTSELPGTTKP